MKPRIGLQLYSLRDQFAEDFYGTLRRVADMGYKGVETASFSANITPRQAKQRFEELGLTVVAAHCPLPLGETQEFALSLLNDLKCDTAIWHGWPQDERYQTVEGVRELADAYNAAHAVCAEQGLRLGLHNHWWEFADVEGRTPHARLRELLHPEIFFELDTYWIQTAGRNPAEVVAEAGSRANLLHIKDGPATQNDAMVAVGAGTLDIPAIVRASQNRAEWLIVEMDSCATDIWQALAESYRYLAENDFARAD